METKEEMAKALVILLDLPNEHISQLLKLSVKTLRAIFEGQRKNALEYQHMYELSRKK